jgi:hypothetical protein
MRLPIPVKRSVGRYLFKMKNISIKGVKASVQGHSPESIEIGDMCGVSFCTDSALTSEVADPALHRRAEDILGADRNNG